MSKRTILSIACAAAQAALSHLHAQTSGAAARSESSSSSEAAAPTAAKSVNGKEFVSDEILVGFKPGAAAGLRENARNAMGAKTLKEFSRIGVQHWKLPPGLTVARAIEILSANPNVRFAEPNYIVHTNELILPDDELRGDLWGMHNVGQNGGIKDADIDALEAWQLAPGEAPVVVGVIDTGIDYNHPDLKDKMLRDPNGKVIGWDFVNNDDDPMDDNRHGTHVAGTIAGAGNNGGVGVIGVAGLNPNVRLVPIKFLSASGSGTTDNAISAVLWATEKGIKITNNSWGGGAASVALEDAIRESESLFVAAAGNNASSSLHYPAAYALPNVLAVAATDEKDALAYFSNYGSTWVHLGAPGVNILSTTPADTYSRLNGTSMATPHVAGAAALALSKNPGLTITQLKQLLENGDEIPALLGKTSSGRRLNIAKVLAAPGFPTDDETAPVGIPTPVIEAASVTQTSLIIGWGQGDSADGAYAYDLRYRINSQIDDESDWNSATPVYGEPAPPSEGSVMVEGLSPGIEYYFALRVIDLAGNTSSISANATAKTVPIGWKTEIVDSQGEVGNYRSLAFNASGTPIIAYSDQTNNRIKVATRNPTTWLMDAFGSGYGGVSLALVPQGVTGAGVPSVSWATTKLYFATKASGSWAISTIEKTSVQGDVTSLAYAPDGTPAISYRVISSSGGLKFAWRSGSTWKTQVVAAGAGARYSSLAFKPDGNPMIAYSDDVDADNTLDTLSLAEGTKGATGYTWVTRQIETGVPGYGVFCSLTTDSAGNPLIVHKGPTHIRFLQRANDTWFASDVASGSSCDLVATTDSSGATRVYVSYVIGGKAKVATAPLPTAAGEAPVWIVSLAENETAVSGKPSIKIAGGVPSLSYNISGDLRFTTEAPGYEGPQFLRQDDMESGLDGWTTEGNRNDPGSRNQPPTPGASNLWHQTTRRGSDPGHTPVTSWYYGIEEGTNAGTYNTGSRNWGRLKSPQIWLKPGSRAELKVSQLVAAEGGSRYENGEIQIREGGTGAWTTIFSRASRTSTSFITDTLNLTPYLGKTIEIGFFFDTKDSGFNQYEGWYLDDVTLKWWP